MNIPYTLLSPWGKWLQHLLQHLLDFVKHCWELGWQMVLTILSTSVWFYWMARWKLFATPFQPYWNTTPNSVERGWQMVMSTPFNICKKKFRMDVEAEFKQLLNSLFNMFQHSWKEITNDFNRELNHYVEPLIYY